MESKSCSLFFVSMFSLKCFCCYHGYPGYSWCCCSFSCCSKFFPSFLCLLNLICILCTECKNHIAHASLCGNMLPAVGIVGIVIVSECVVFTVSITFYICMLQTFERDSKFSLKIQYMYFFSSIIYRHCHNSSVDHIVLNV